MNKRPSIQRRLVVLACGVLLVLGITSGYVTYRVVRQNLTRTFDLGLRTKARTLLSAVRIEADGRLELEYSDESMPEFLPSPHAEYFEIRDSAGQLVEKSKSLGLRELVTKPKHKHRNYAVKDIRLPDGRRGRAVRICGWPTLDEDETDGRPTSGTAAGRVCVVVARERETLDQALAMIAASLAFGSLLVAVGGAAALMLVVRLGLAPLLALAQKMEKLGPDDLDYQLTTPTLPRELVPIAERLEQLFARLRSAIERERRYTSDVAHELRTPLAELRTTLEVAACWPEDLALVKTSLEQALGSVGEAQALVDTLLELARKGDAATPPPVHPVNCRKIIDEELRKLAKVAEVRGIKFSWLDDCPSDQFKILANKDLFRGIIRNILSNAVEYAPEETEIQLKIFEAENQKIWIEVRNQAPDLTAEDLENMCQPFWRKDPARSDRQHSGLGLTVTQALCKIMGIHLFLELAQDNVLVVRLEASKPCDVEEH